jgi:hypothetical protein
MYGQFLIFQYKYNVTLIIREQECAYHKDRKTRENYILHLGSNLRLKGGVFLAFHLKNLTLNISLLFATLFSS